MRNIILLFIICILTVNSLADGFAYSKGKVFTRIQETHQLAVIKLQEGHADVSMYISITDIPEGESITYILPFWYQPDNFVITEENSTEKFTEILDPLNNKISDLNKKALTNYSLPLQLACMAPVGILSTIFFPIFAKARAKGGSNAISAFQVSSTPHAKAMLYKINAEGNDLQQLIKQSGLPAKLIEPLMKYKTRYFAVMKLTGVKKDNRRGFGKGIMYTFSHKLTGNKYIYPLGTGAAWSKPIPSTEVYITCPDKMQLSVTAPEYGSRTDRYEFRRLFLDYQNSLYVQSVDESIEDRKNYAATSSNIDYKVKNAGNIWQIKYFMSNPSSDITAEFSQRKFKVIDVINFLFLNHIMPWILIVISLCLSWYASFIKIIKPYCELHPEIDPVNMLKKTIIITTCELIAFNIILICVILFGIWIQSTLHIIDNPRIQALIFFITVVSPLILLLFLRDRIRNGVITSKTWSIIFQFDPDNRRLASSLWAYMVFALSTLSFAGLYILL